MQRKVAATLFLLGAVVLALAAPLQVVGSKEALPPTAADEARTSYLFEQQKIEQGTLPPTDKGGGVDAFWLNNLVYDPGGSSITGRDVKVGKFFRGPADDTVRVVMVQSASPRNIMMFTDITNGTAAPVWRSDIIWSVPTSQYHYGLELADFDGDGQTEVVFGNYTYNLVWSELTGLTGNVWTAPQVICAASSGYFHEVCFGDADNLPGNELVFTNTSGYRIYMAKWVAAPNTWLLDTIYTGTSTLYGAVAIGDVDPNVPGNEVWWSNSSGGIGRAYYIGASTWNFTLQAFTGGSAYDAVIADIDPAIAGNEFWVLNGSVTTTYGILFEAYVTAPNVFARVGRYTTWSYGTYGELAAGDFDNTHPGAELVACGYNSTLIPAAYEVREFYYNSGTATWYSEQVGTYAYYSYGITVGDVNKFRTDNLEIAGTGNYGRCHEFEQNIPALHDVQVSAILGPAVLQNGRSWRVDVRVANQGLSTENNFDVRCTLYSGTTPVYNGLISIPTLGPIPATKDTWFTLTTYAPPVGPGYTLAARTVLAGDLKPGNDRQTVSLVSYQAYTIGGPDAGNYWWKDNDYTGPVGGPASPTFSWIPYTGGTLAVLTSNDDGYGTIPLPFPFTYRGVTYSTNVNVGANGWLDFSGTCTYLPYDIGTFPQTSYLYPFVSLWSRDLYLNITYEPTAGVYYKTVGTAPNRQFVIVWRGAYAYGSYLDWAEFEIVLNEADNTFILQYNDVTMSGGHSYAATADIGCQNAAGTAGLSYMNNNDRPGNQVTAGRAIKFYYYVMQNDVGVASVTAPPATISQRNGTVYPACVIQNYGALAQGTFAVRCTVYGPGGEIRFADEQTVGPLGVGGTAPATFAGWLPSTYEATSVVFRTFLGTDENPSNDRVPRVVNVVSANTTGGPDAETYRWIDNDAPGGPTYAWIDTVGATFIGNGDDNGFPVNLPFPFWYRGTVYQNGVLLTTNGHINMDGDLLTWYDISAYPNGAATAIVGPWLQDLYANPSYMPYSGIYTKTLGTAPNRQFAIIFQDFYPYGTYVSPATFEIILNEADFSIVYQYQDVDMGSASHNNGINADVGMQNALGTVGLSYELDGVPATELLSAGRTIRWTNDPVSDGAALSIDAPLNGNVFYSGTQLNPLGTVRNNGNRYAAVTADFTLTGTTGYSNSGSTGTLGLGASEQIAFAQTPALAAGDYLATLTTTVSPDPTPGNNTQTLRFLVMDEPTLTYPLGAINNATPTFDWDDLPAAVFYDIEIATDAGFTSIVDAGSFLFSSDFLGTYTYPEGNYYWRVRGISNYFVGPWNGTMTAVGQFEVDLGVPSMVTLEQPPDGAINVIRQPVFDWSDVTFAKKATLGVSALGKTVDAPVRYHIELRDDLGALVTSATGLAASTWTCDVVLDYASDYSWTVEAYDLAGNLSGWPTPFTFTTGLTEAPTLVQPADAARLTNADVTFEWNAAADANYYWLQASQLSDFSTLAVDQQQSGLTFDAIGMADGHYYWRVASSPNGGADYGDWSTVWEFDLDATAPDAPALVTPGPGATNVPLDVTFDWDEVTLKAKSLVTKTAKQTTDAIDYYDFQVARDAGFTDFVYDLQLTETEYPQSGLAYLTPYWWRVRGVDDFGNIGDWAVGSFTSIIEAPTAFNLLAPADGATGVAATGALTWEVSDRAAAYDVYLDQNPIPTTLYGTSATPTLAYDLAGGTTFYWQVVARNNGGIATSAIWRFQTSLGLPPGWFPKDSMPSPQVKDGGAMCYNGDFGRVYAVKGNKSDEFFQYTPVDSTWKKLTSVTAGTKAVGKGAAITTGAGYVFVMKGNGTCDFYKFDIAESTWIKAKDIPLALDQTATRGKTVKAGGSLAYVNKNDTAEYVYTLKGYGTDFYKYDIARDTFYSLTAAPYTSKPKYDKGSWICYDGTQYIYVMQAKYNALYRYDVRGEQWDVTVLKGMPLNSTVTGKTNKKVGDGSCAAWNGDANYLFAMKGGGTQEAWKYVPGTDGDSWTEVESIPQAYATGAKKKKVKSGGAAVYYPETGVFYVQKGNKSNQFWVYVPGGSAVYAARPQRDGVTAGNVTSVAYSLAVCPNPLASGYATIRYSLPRAGMATLSVNDVTGRVVMTRTLVASRTGAAGLDLRGLSAGVYLVKLTADGYTTSQKLVVER